MITYNILISCFIYTRLFPKIRLYTIIFENTPPPCASPYISLISCNLILLILHWHFEKSPLVEWFHTIYWSAVSLTSYLYLQSESTLSFSKIPCISMRVHTLFDLIYLLKLFCAFFLPVPLITPCNITNFCSDWLFDIVLFLLTVWMHVMTARSYS